MRALLRITSHIKTYEPGEKLGSEFNESEIKRLVRLKAVEGAADIEEAEEDLSDDLFGDSEPDKFLTETELKKLKKAELIEYAARIGLNGLDSKLSNEELTNNILNYIEEIEAGEQV